MYDSGVSETVLGVLTAVASLFGIFGSLVFPVLRKKVLYALSDKYSIVTSLICCGFSI